MTSVHITPDLITEAMQSQPVRDQLGVIASRIEKRAQTLAAGQGGIDTRVYEWVRPKGRPVAQVYARHEAEREFGSRRVSRWRILGRAGEDAA